MLTDTPGDSVVEAVVSAGSVGAEVVVSFAGSLGAAVTVPAGSVGAAVTLIGPSTAAVVSADAIGTAVVSSAAGWVGTAVMLLAVKSIGPTGAATTDAGVVMNMSPSVAIAVSFSPWRKRSVPDTDPRRTRMAASWSLLMMCRRLLFVVCISH